MNQWKETTWGDLATLEYGKALRDYRKSSGCFRVYGTNGPIGWHTQALYDKPSVIIGRKGAYRGVYYAAGPFFVIDTAFYLKPKIGFDMRWAYYELLTHDINSMDSGSAIPSTSRDAFYCLPVCVPPLEVQHAIAKILSELDDKIELNRQMNETLEEMARALFKSWFVDFDPVRAKIDGRWRKGESLPGLPAHLYNLFPDRLADSELGEIPDRWEIRAIGDLAEVVGGSTPSTNESSYWKNGVHPWATPKDLSTLLVPVLLDTERQITDAGLAHISSSLLPSGTVLLSSRAPIGYLAIAEVAVAINQGFIAMKPRIGVSNLFLLYWAEAAHDEIVSYANGSTFLEISKSNFRPIRVAAPPEPVMDAFDRITRPLYRRIVFHERESRTLSAMRDMLLPKLVSGELKVNDSEMQREKTE